MAVTSRYVWQAKSLAIGASRATSRPSARAQAASWTSSVGAVDRGLGVGEVVRQRLERAERLVELLAVLGVLRGDVERRTARRPRPAPRRGSRRRASSRPTWPRRWRRRRRGGRRPAPARRRRSTSYWVSEAIDIFWVSVTPVGLRVDEARRPRGRARRRCAPASPGARPSWRTPRAAWCRSSTRPSPSASPAAARPWRTEAVVGLEPGGRQDRLARGDAAQPLLLLLLGAGATDDAGGDAADTKCGVGASERPSSS